MTCVMFMKAFRRGDSLFMHATCYDEVLWFYCFWRDFALFLVAEDAKQVQWKPVHTFLELWCLMTSL